jgi:hypothetical protein
MHCKLFGGIYCVHVEKCTKEIVFHTHKDWVYWNNMTLLKKKCLCRVCVMCPGVYACNSTIVGSFMANAEVIPHFEI